MSASVKMPESYQRIETCRLSRKEELELVAAKFTAFLVQRRLISSAPIPRKRVRDLYLEYQERNPSRIYANDIIDGLFQIHVVKKSLSSHPEGSTIQFKSAILQTVINESPSTEQLSKPRIRVFTNQSHTFRCKAALEPDISGLHCHICDVTFAGDDACKIHKESTEHILRSLYRSDRQKLKTSLPFLEVTPVKVNIDVNEKKTFLVILKNISKEPLPVEIKEVFVLNNKDEIVPVYYVPKTLKNGEQFECQLQVNFAEYKSHSYPLVVLVKNRTASEIFNVLVEAEFNVIDKSLHDLGPTEQFHYLKKNTIEFVELNFVSGPPLPSSVSKPLYTIPLVVYPIPASLNRILNCGFKIKPNSIRDKTTLNEIKSLLLDKSKEKVLHNVEALNSENYCQRMQHLLWMEEHQMNRNLHYYDREDIVLLPEKRGFDTFFKLEVPGLSESRPSILRGDEVYIRRKNDTHKYQGIVHFVEENYAFLGLNHNFNYVSGEKVTAEFSLNRITMRICHRAVNLIKKDKLYSIIFPSEFFRKPKNLTFPFKNRQVEENKQQHQAVRNIVNNTAFPAPYLIYGPPGTGKTSTIVEAIAQIRLNIKGVRICACAPSNAAADLLALRLLDFVPPSGLFRVYSMSRSVREIPDKLRKLCNLNENGTDLPFPKVIDILNKSIVVVTPITAGRIHGIGGAGFDYVFIDEAGHAEEPLTLIPAAGLLKRSMEGTVSGNLILAGDPKQLGPIIHSRLASHLGLDMSLMERLMKQSNIYKRNPADNSYDDRVITKLVRNYRSHPTLLHIPNKLFYGGELMACADVDKITAFCSWSELPKKNFPIIFHGVRGKDDREKNSPSYFNLLEIQTVKMYIKELLFTKIKGYTVKQTDIVVITPYRKQIHKFRQYFGQEKLKNVEVKSVEEFQGQEKKIVIISTVRSQERFVQSDYQFGIGFLRNPKRFNVATTRAQALMIIVGNPDILQTDPCWRALMEYCSLNGGFKGERPKGAVRRDLDPNETLAINLAALVLKSDEIPESERLGFHRSD